MKNNNELNRREKIALAISFVALIAFLIYLYRIGVMNWLQYNSCHYFQMFCG